MATMRIYHPWTGTLVAGNITVLTDRLIQYTAGTVTVEFGGVGFTYQGSEYITGGTVTSFKISDSANGGVQLEVSGLSRSAVNTFGYATLTFFNNLMSDPDTIHGSPGDDVLTGWSGGDVIYGGAGDDVLDDNSWFSSGRDSLVGGPGNDTYIIEQDNPYPNDTITESAGEGTDWVLVRGSYTLPDHVEHLEMFGERDYNVTGYDWSAQGNALDNILLADDQNNRLQGMGGNDYLEGAAGNDTLDGGAGADSLDGGDGNDVYVIDLQDAIADSGGIDTVVVPFDGYQLTDTRMEQLMLAAGMVSFTSGATPDRIFGTDLANKIDGGAGNDTLDGGKGNDTLVGGAGADLMTGGLGIDTYYIDNPGDIVADSAPYPADFQEAGYAFSSVSYDMESSPSLRKLYLIGSSPLSASGAQMRGELIVGNDGDNTLSGWSADTLCGGLGNDTLIYRDGSMVLDGDAGIDTADLGMASLLSPYRRVGGTIEIWNSTDRRYDSLIGVDILKFIDQTIVVNSHQATGAVSIGGTAMVGRTLQAATGSIADGDGIGTGALSYQWYRGPVAIEGATTSSYVVTTPDIDASLRVRVRFIDGQGNTESLWSAAVTGEPLDTTAPQLVSMTPADGARNVTVASNFILEFDEEVVRGTGTVVLKNGNVIVESFDVANSTRIVVSGSTVTIDPSLDLSFDRYYNVQVGTGTFHDLAGNPLGPTTLRVFQTGGSAPGYTAVGTAGADLLRGSSSSEELQGLAGNDTLIGGSGNDTLVGGEGLDTAVMNTAYSSGYSAVPEGQGMRLHADGTDLLVGIERVRYVGPTLAYDTHVGETVWNVYALLWAGFGRAPAQALLSEWVRQADAGLSLEQLAQAMLNRYAPAVTASELVAYLYGTIIGGVPSAADAAYFSGQIGPGRLWDSLAEFITFVATHEANTARFVGFAGSAHALETAYFL